MKKIIYNFLVVSFLSLSFSSLCLEKTENQNNQSSKISKKDIAKITAAVVGATFFIMAGPMSYYVKLWGLKQQKPHETPPPLRGLPSYVLLPFSLLIGAGILNIDKAFFGRKRDEMNEEYMLSLFIISTTLSSLIPTFLLIRYSLKKLKQLRSKKPNPSESRFIK